MPQRPVSPPRSVPYATKQQAILQWQHQVQQPSTQQVASVQQLPSTVPYTNPATQGAPPAIQRSLPSVQQTLPVAQQHPSSAPQTPHQLPPVKHIPSVEEKVGAQTEQWRKDYEAIVTLACAIRLNCVFDDGTRDVAALRRMLWKRLSDLPEVSTFRLLIWSCCGTDRR